MSSWLYMFFWENNKHENAINNMMLVFQLLLKTYSFWTTRIHRGKLSWILIILIFNKLSQTIHIPLDKQTRQNGCFDDLFFHSILKTKEEIYLQKEECKKCHSQHFSSRSEKYCNGKFFLKLKYVIDNTFFKSCV